MKDKNIDLVSILSSEELKNAIQCGIREYVFNKISNDENFGFFYKSNIDTIIADTIKGDQDIQNRIKESIFKRLEKDAEKNYSDNHTICKQILDKCFEVFKDKFIENFGK